MNFRELIVTIIMVMSVRDLLPATVSASSTKLGKEGITDEMRARMRKVHEKAKDNEPEMSAMEHRAKLDIQSSFAKEIMNPANEKGNGEAGENRLLQEYVTAPVTCEESDPEFDGVICVIVGYPSSSFNVALVGCPSNTESTRDFFFCGGCLVYAGDFDNEDFCATCSLCSDNDVGFDCDNVASGECVAYDCTTGICSNVGGQPSGNPPNPAPFGNPPTAQIGNNPAPFGNNPGPFEKAPTSGATASIYNPVPLSFLGGATAALMMLLLH
jgi:hypothetical protein